MTTAQLTGKLKIGPYTGNAWGFEISEMKERRCKTGHAASAPARPAFRTLTGAALEMLEREDTLSDKVAGYGTCGLAFFYLAAQVVRTFF